MVGALFQAKRSFDLNKPYIRANSPELVVINNFQLGTIDSRNQILVTFALRKDGRGLGSSVGRAMD